MHRNENSTKTPISFSKMVRRMKCILSHKIIMLNRLLWYSKQKKKHDTRSCTLTLTCVRFDVISCILWKFSISIFHSFYWTFKWKVTFRTSTRWKYFISNSITLISYILTFSHVVVYVYMSQINFPDIIRRFVLQIMQNKINKW